MEGTSEFYVYRARMLRASGDLDASILEGKRAVELDPDSYEAHMELGISLLHKYKAKDAVREFELAMAIQPDSFDARYRLGQSLERTGDLHGAIEVFQDATKLYKDNSLMYFALGLTLARARRYEEALPALHTAYELGGDKEVALNYVSVMVSARGSKLDTASIGIARSLLAEVFTKNPNYAPALLRQALLEWAIGDRSKALSLVESAIQADPFYNPPYTFKFHWLIRMGRWGGLFSAARGIYEGHVRELSDRQK